MLRFTTIAGAAALAALSIATAHAAVSENAGADALAATTEQVELDKELVVRNWILCATRAHAEAVVHAADASAREAAEVFARLQGERSCGRFPQMRVILEIPIVESSPFAELRAKAYGAQIRLNGKWVPAFVVNGGPPNR